MSPTTSRDGVVFVDLVKVTQPDDGGRRHRRRPPTCPRRRRRPATRRSSVARRRANCLLVVDNCEHVQDAARTLARAAARRLPVAARAGDQPAAADAAVRARGVRARPVARHADGRERRGGVVRRADDRRRCRPPPQPAELDAIAEICAALDGHGAGDRAGGGAGRPASASTPLAGALGSRLRPPRHRHHGPTTGTARCRAAIDWSYDLLAPDERAVLRAAAMFAAPPDLDAVSAVERPPAGSGRSTRSARLVDWNLVSLKAGSPDPLPGAGDDPPVRHRAPPSSKARPTPCARPTSTGAKRRLDDLSRAGAGRRAVVRRGGRRARRRPRRAGVGASPPGVT